MNYDEIAAALEQEERLDAEMGKIGEGVDEQLASRRVRHGKDLDALDGAF
tara:strand:- start:93 stop:242 length:150 start_codon:yes stop_codon:yes gene_type:complete